MLKIFFATFFIAELIIALTVIVKIYQFNRCVNACNDLILTTRHRIQPIFIDLRLVIEDFQSGLAKLQNYIKLKREEYSFQILKTSLIYGCIFLLRGKYKKSVFAFQLIKEIYEGIKEAEI